MSAMSDCQSIPRRLSASRYSVKRFAGIGRKYSADMKEKSRSEYGARLYAARKHAGLTQTALAKAVGMSQSAFAEAETKGLGSTYTSQLASHCGVSAHWLATGEGSMTGPSERTRPEADQLADALQVLTRALRKADKNARIALEPLLASMAKEPEDAGNKSHLILKLLVTKDDGIDGSHHDRPGHISGELGSIDVGGNQDGRSDRIAAEGGGKK